MTIKKLLKAVRKPVVSFRVLKSMTRGQWYKLKYELILSRATFGEKLRVHGKLVIKGPGKVYIGNNVSFHMKVTPFTHSKHAVIKIGDNVILNGTRFGAAESIIIGSRCILADCRIMDTDFHSISKNRHSKDAYVACSPVTIGDNVWIGAQAAVLKGVSIGENSVIGFGAVVIRDIGANVIAVGNPAKVVKRIPG